MQLRTLTTLFVSSAMALQAGVLLTEQVRDLKDNSTGSTKVHIEPDRLRMESDGSHGRQVVLYRADQQTMYIVDPGKKKYQKMTRQQLEQLGNQLSQVQQMMQEQFKNMPPQQRQMMEKMMKGKMAGMQTEAPAPIVYRKTASGENVGQWTCDRYEGYRGQEKVSEVCSAAFADVPFQQGDIQVLQDLAGFFETLTSQLGMEVPAAGVSSPFAGDEYPGVPVQRVSYVNGEPRRVSDLVEVSRQDFDASLFEVPAGYKEEKMKLPEMPGR